MNPKENFICHTIHFAISAILLFGILPHSHGAETNGTGNIASQGNARTTVQDRNSETGLSEPSRKVSGSTPMPKQNPGDDQEYVTVQRLHYGVWSILYTTLGLLFGIVMLHRAWLKTHPPNNTYVDFYAQGQFVQLIVIILIAGNVCSLAIMGILQKSEVSTIYAGIIGYILGKRTAPDNAKPPGGLQNPPAPPNE